VPFYFIYQFEDEAAQLRAELPLAQRQRLTADYITNLAAIPLTVQLEWAQSEDEAVKATLAAHADLLPQATKKLFAHRTKFLRQRTVWEALLANPVVPAEIKQKILAFLEEVKNKKPVQEGINPDGTSKEQSYIGYAFLLGWLGTAVAAYVPIHADNKTLGVKIGYSLGIGLLGGLGAVLLYAMVIHPLIMKFHKRRGY